MELNLTRFSKRVAYYTPPQSFNDEGGCENSIAPTDSNLPKSGIGTAALRMDHSCGGGTELRIEPSFSSDSLASSILFAPMNRVEK